jgi:hypothetical protein
MRSIGTAVVTTLIESWANVLKEQKNIARKVRKPVRCLIGVKVLGIKNNN